MDAVTARGLERLFSDCFSLHFNTKLAGGAPEPFYTLLRRGVARLYYREDFVRSAMAMEIAHWCVAWSLRRQQDDFGYWYHPEGRSVQQQAAFLQVEVLPQSF